VVKGDGARPRLAVYRSLSHIYVQAVDDASGKTLASAGSHEKPMRESGKSGGNAAAAKAVGKLIAERLLAKGVSIAVFDRGGFNYHGRVKALADGAREAGLRF
jgi:large subunit ribosomal protein L18